MLKVDDMDAEWIELIFEARKLGISIEEIYEFLHRNSREEVSTKNT